MPSVTHTESLLLFNSNSILGKGFTFWNGTRWSHVNNNFFWGTYGDYDVVSTNFLGTTDIVAFVISTNSTARLEITVNQRLESYNLGNSSLPAWNVRNLDNCFYSRLDDLRFALNGNDFLNVSNSTGIIFNASQNDIDFSINGLSKDVLFIDSGLDRMAILPTSSLESTLHIQGTSSNVMIESLGVSNPYNNGLDMALVYVDRDGQLKLESTPHVTQISQFEYESNYLASSISASNISMGTGSIILYTTTQEMFDDALLEVVHQTSIEVSNSVGGIITDGIPRKYGIRILVNGRVIGQTSKMFSSSPISTPTASGFMYLF